MSKNIRGQYIKNLVADKEALGEQLKESTKDSIRALLAETVKDSLRDILKEDDDKEKDQDSFEVEEVGTEQTEDGNETEASEITADAETDEAGAESGEEDEEETIETDGENTEEDFTETGEDETEADTEGDDMWKDLEKFKGENGEYDLTGMGSEDVIKVLKVMGPDDSVRVVKNSNGSITLTDENNETEYIIDIEGTMTDGDSAGTETSEEDGYEELAMNEEDLGYTDNYQNTTAMTTPDNHEPGKNVRTWDKGVPQGTEKPWVGNKGDMSPYDKKVNEGSNECNDECSNECNNECGSTRIYEIEIDTDDMMDDTTIDETSMAGGARTHGKKGDTNHSEADAIRHIHKDYPRPTNEAADQKMKNLVRKANAIFEENKQLKTIAEDLRKKISEAVVVNASLAKIINLVTENSTTRNEKIDMLKRFNEVKSVEEGNALYETIARELKSNHPSNNGGTLISTQLNESKAAKAPETQMLRSDDLNETLEFMKRLNKIK